MPQETARIKKGLWANELDGVLWSHRTTPRRSTGKTPFSLCHGVEAMAPAEYAVATVWRLIMPEDVKLNNERLYDHNVLAEEEHDQSLVRIQNYQHQAACYYNKRVKGVSMMENWSSERHSKTRKNGRPVNLEQTGKDRT